MILEQDLLVSGLIRPLLTIRIAFCGGIGTSWWRHHDDFDIDPSVKEYIDPANFFFVRAFENDLSRDIVFEGVEAVRRV
jgi:hypothetical protein